jgi:hypothetical protein
MLMKFEPHGRSPSYAAAVWTRSWESMTPTMPAAISGLGKSEGKPWDSEMSRNAS